MTFGNSFLKRAETRATASILVGVFFILSCLFTCALAQGKEAGMVLDLKGTAKAVGQDGKARALEAMSNILEGDTVEVGSKGKMVFALFSSGAEYALEGASRARVSADKVEKLSGTMKMNVAKGGVALPKNYRVGSRTILGMVVRKVAGVFSSPLDNSAAMSGTLTFKWEIFDKPEKETFVLKDSKGKEFYSTVVENEELNFPPKGCKALTAGAEYAAEVGPARAKGAEEFDPAVERISTRFKVLSTSDASFVKSSEVASEKAMKANPGDSATLIKLMLVYKNFRLYDRAVATGLRLEKLMPGNTGLYLEMADVYRMMKRDDKAKEYKEKAGKRGNS